MRRWDGVVVHIAAGYYEGTISWQKNPSADVSSHFIVSKSGKIAQMVDTADAAWTQRDGNGEWLSIENEGFLPERLTDAQVVANAKILAKAHQVYGVPLVVTNTPRSRGLGHHSMGPENDINWGHSQCPGPAIKAQKPAIVALAKQFVAQGGFDVITPEDAEVIAKAFVVQWLGSSGPSVGVALQGLYGGYAPPVVRIEAALAELRGKDPVNEQQIIDGVLAGLGSKDLDDAVSALKAAFGDRTAELAAKLAEAA